MNAATRTKPVMDIAAPKGSAASRTSAVVDRSSVSAMFTSQKPAKPARVAKRPAAARQERAKAQPMLSANKASVVRKAPIASIQKPVQRTPEEKHAPVALITVAVFVVLIISALAVTMYVTSRTV